MKIFEVIDYFETIIPLDLQESYDNCGLQVGDTQQELTCALITLDITDTTWAALRRFVGLADVLGVSDDDDVQFTWHDDGYAVVHELRISGEQVAADE